MDIRSPFYRFSPDSVGRLVWREAVGLPITPADVQRVVEATCDAMSDPLVRRYAERVQSGEIRNRGRPKKEYPPLLFVETLYEIRKEEIWERRRWEESGRGRVRGDLEPCFEAAEYVARFCRLASDRGLLNWMSQERKRVVDHAERSRAFFMK